MKVLVIGGTKGTPTQKEREYYQKYIDFFKRSAQHSQDAVTVHAAMMDDLLIQVGDGVFSIYDTYNDQELSEYDVFFLRGDKFRVYMDIIATINEYAAQHGIKMINDFRNVRDSSKLLQATRFETIGVPVAKTLNVNTALLSSFNRVDDWTFPCIMKAKHGSHGNDNFVVHSLDDVRRISEEYVATDKGFVLQRFVPNDGDYRILIVGNETIVIGRSAQNGTHLNNTSKGGAATEVAIDSIPEQVIDQAKKIASAFKMTIAGVDALQDKDTGEYYFLEVNAQPQLMSGAFIEKKEGLIGKLLDSLTDAR